MLLLGTAGRVGCRSAKAARQPRPWSWTVRAVLVRLLRVRSRPTEGTRL